MSRRSFFLLTDCASCASSALASFAVRSRMRFALRAVWALLLFLSAILLHAQTLPTFYWDIPAPVTPEATADAFFPAVVSDEHRSWCFYEESGKIATGDCFWISLQTYEHGQWSKSRRVAGPFSYSGDIPDCFSVVRSASCIVLAVAAYGSEVQVYASHDDGASFTQSSVSVREQTVVGPRLFVAKDGTLVLFASLTARKNVTSDGDSAFETFSFSLVFSTSRDGRSWAPFAPFAPSEALSHAFSPFLCASAFGDVVVFQAYHEDETHNRFSNQLYVTVSVDALQTWAPPVLLTNATALSSRDEKNATFYHNQRPFLYAYDEHLYVAWERSAAASEAAAVWIGELTERLTFASSAFQISPAASAHRPSLFSYDNRLYALWFDARRGQDAISLFCKNGYLWDEVSLFPSTAAGKADSSGVQRFPCPVFADGELSFVWQERTQPSFASRARQRTPSELQAAGKSCLYALSPDHTVQPPRIVATSFTEGKRSTAEQVRAQVVFPADPSGISGFSWMWTQSRTEEPPKKLTNRASDTQLSSRATHDGVWYFKARVRDYAGNWSAVATLSYHRDITPPLAPEIVLPSLDANGFVSANSFSVAWKPNRADDDVAGYSWSLEYIAPLDRSLWENSRHPLALSAASTKQLRALQVESKKTALRASLPPRRLLSAKKSARYTNVANGLYAFSVCAIDAVGNIGKRTVVPLLLNKYEPETAVLDVQSVSDAFGTLTVTVLGRCFSYDGTISELYIDRDGLPPYDMLLRADQGDFEVTSDEQIQHIRLENADAGVYKIGLFHTDRGLYFSDKTLTIDEYGTVKFFTPYQFTPDWSAAPAVSAFSVTPAFILMWVVCACSALIFVCTIRGFAQTVKETAEVRRDIITLMRGTMMLQEKRKKAAAVHKRRSSLKFKFSAFTVQGVLVVAALVSIPLGYLMLRVQSRTLAAGLEQRVTVLLNSIATSVRMYMPSQNDLELGALPNLSASLPETEYISILGLPRTQDNTHLNYVWATNDSEISAKLDSAEYVQGASRMTDATVLSVVDRFTTLNDEAEQSVGEMAHRINELTQEGASLAARTDYASNVRRNQINDEVRLLSTHVTDLLGTLSDAAAGSEPAFDVRHLDASKRHYLFYKPVLYRQGSEETYVRAVIVMQVSTEPLLQQVARSSRTIVLVSLLIAAIVTIIGTLSSLVFVSLLVRPIRLLVDHVEMISHTRRKETLAGQEIDVRTHDEIGLLGETVNEMTRSLVKAAHDENLLMDGKAVQQAFIPLLSDGAGHKKTTAMLQDEAAAFFGYYEGASGVSGDYFDYKKLDERWYCIIKCDASGHGVPAALIMTIVATMFRQYFDSWSWRINGTALDKLVVSINDFIESLGLQGKFTTLLLCLFDSKTGDVYVCNAGDNIIHYYDFAQKKMRSISLSQTPAAGSLPSFMVSMKGGFTVEPLHLHAGDVLFLYTDGIEESTRKFRDSDFAVTKCMAGSEGEPHGNHKAGDEFEQFTTERIQAVVEAVFSRSVYRLEKYHAPDSQELLEFDFSHCDGSIQDAVLALAAVEKVFRIYKSPDCTESDVVRVDKNIDIFLKKHFNRYDFYCSAQNDVGESNYLYYTNLREDEQLDDLTLLVVQKK